ncbi:melanocyte-stimulating hormone receptor [Hyla sarda]|uniref:melanocyte-stimulating hormone receptor n=1 Tax=Hyla sarda TaxID=327740 RepID=UPI0024C42930|nr:melanocyte-stimulating hormone receptor [Hyla sarda]
MTPLTSLQLDINITNFTLQGALEVKSNETVIHIEVPKGVFLFLCFLSLLENILVVVAIAKNHNLHSPMYYFICCLAASDMLVSISNLIETVIMILLLHGIIEHNIPMVKMMDNIVDTMILCSLVTSLSFLGAIAVDRYVTIFYALRYHNIITQHRVICVITGIWMASIACSITFIVFSHSSVVIWCLIVFFIFMLVLMLGLYIHMFVLARKHSQIIMSQQKGARRGFSPHQAAAKLRGAITLTMLLGIFFLCWGPFFLHLTLYVSCPKHPFCLEYFKYFNINFVLMIFNSIIDPIIYAFRSQELRKTLKDIVLCCSQ